jgi:hypothetical protein
MNLYWSVIDRFDLTLMLFSFFRHCNDLFIQLCVVKRIKIMKDNEKVQQSLM